MPRRFGRYQVGSPLRSTAARTVYAAERTDGERSVELHISLERQEEFLFHAHRLAVLDDPYLLPVYEVGVHEGHAFAAAAPERETLEHRLRAGPVPYQHALRLAGDLVHPLETLERAGMPVGEIPASAVALRGERALLAPLEIDGPERPRGDESSGAALAGMLRSMVGQNEAPLELDALLADPPESAAELLQRARDIPAPAPQRPTRRVPARAVAVQVAVALAAVGAFIFAATRGGESTPQTPAPETAAGRLAATIPLGARPTSVAVDGDLLWVGTTAGTLIRVDAVTNKVVGAPVEVAGAVASSIVRAGEGAVFLVAEDRLYRIDPTSGEVTARRRIDGQALGATVAGGQLWVTRRAAAQSRDHLATLQRFDAQTLAPVGLALQTEDLPQDVDVSGSTAWVANSGAGSVTRVDTDKGISTSSSVGGLPVAGVILAGKYWVTDFAGGYVTEIDAASGRHDAIVRVPGAVSIVAGDGGALWVTSVPGEGRDAPARLVRLDPVAHRVIGAPVQLGSDVGWAAFARGSVWVGSRSKSALLRIEPTSPAPAASPAPSIQPDTLSSGPLSAGTKRSGQFALPFDLALEDDAWIGILARDNYAAVSRLTPTHAAVGLVLPDRSIGANGSASKIASAGRLVSDLRRDPRLTVTPLAAASVGGTPAIGLQVSARTDAPAAPNYCDHVCVPVLAAGKLTITVDAGVQQELRIFERQGRVVVASVTAPAGSPELARVRDTLATLRFR